MERTPIKTGHYVNRYVNREGGLSPIFCCSAFWEEWAKHIALREALHKVISILRPIQSGNIVYEIEGSGAPPIRFCPHCGKEYGK
jgi:hypothetical protein